IAQQHLGLGGQRPSDADPLLLPARELGGVVVDAVAEADDLEQFAGLGQALGLGHSGDLEGMGDVLHSGARVEEVDVLEDHADAAAGLAQAGTRSVRQVDSVDGHGARGRGFEPGQAADEGGLAGSERPTMPWISPAGTVRSISSRATVSPNTFRRPRSSITGASSCGWSMPTTVVDGGKLGMAGLRSSRADDSG